MGWEKGLAKISLSGRLGPWRVATRTRFSVLVGWEGGSAVACGLWFVDFGETRFGFMGWGFIV